MGHMQCMSSSQQCLSTEGIYGNSQHQLQLRKIVPWPHAFFSYLRTPDGKGMVVFLLAVWYQWVVVISLMFFVVLCSVVLKLAGRSARCATLQMASTYWQPVIPRAFASTRLSIRSCARSLTWHATCLLMELWSVSAGWVLNIFCLTVWKCWHRYRMWTWHLLIHIFHANFVSLVASCSRRVINAEFVCG